MDYTWANDSADEAISSDEDLLKMLDNLLGDGSEHWDSFYKDHTRRVPFFVNAPDESLATWFADGLIKPGRVLDLGCGPGRNAIHMAKQGCQVDAVDFSQEAITWGQDRAAEAGVEINFIQSSMFDLECEPASYDVIYDCGCFHHIAPHRRLEFVPFLQRALKPGGLFGLTCMGAAPPEENGGSDMTDWQVYRDRSMHGGLGYSQQRLRTIFGEAFDVLELRQMRECEPNGAVFGMAFAWVGLFRLRR